MKGYHRDADVQPLADQEELWKKRGLCHGHDEPDLWFPEGRNKAALESLATAICVMCPVLDRCREWALTNREGWGVWAAMTEHELRYVNGLVQHTTPRKASA